MTQIGRTVHMGEGPEPDADRSRSGKGVTLIGEWPESGGRARHSGPDRQRDTWIGVHDTGERDSVTVTLGDHRRPGADRANAALRPDAGEEHSEGTSGFGIGGGEPGRERRRVDVDSGDQAGEFGEQRGVREDRRVRRPAAASRAAGSR